MMHLFFVLSWFACAGGGTIVCEKQPAPDVHVFETHEECVAAATDLMKKNDEDTWRWMNPLHYTCAPSERWVPSVVVAQGSTTSGVSVCLDHSNKSTGCVHLDAARCNTGTTSPDGLFFTPGCIVSPGAPLPICIGCNGEEVHAHGTSYHTIAYRDGKPLCQMSTALIDPVPDIPLCNIWRGKP